MRAGSTRRLMRGRSRAATMDAGQYPDIGRRREMKMNDRQRMRASDRDRQEVVDRLRDAVAEGRLKMDEYVDRMERAYQAVTYGDLAPLHTDLPVPGPATERRAALPAKAPAAKALPAGEASRGFLTGQPMALKVLWTIWLAAVGRRSVRGLPVRRVGCRRRDPACPAVPRAAPAVGESLIQRGGNRLAAAVRPAHIRRYRLETAVCRTTRTCSTNLASHGR